MKKPSVSCLSALFLLLAVNTSLFAQGTEESAARTAEQAGKFREALTQYVAALQKVPDGSTDDQRLREIIIKLVQKLSPPPAVPEEARRFAVRGRTWINEAKNPSDFEEAAKEFARALRVAPWWADGYINQGVALEKAGKFSDAIRSLKLYLLAAPAASDADKVKEQIYALEVRQEKAQKEALVKGEEQGRKRQEEQAKATDPAQIAGEWCTIFGGTSKKDCSPTWSVRIVVNGESIEIWGSWGPGGHRSMMRGRINGANIIGLYFVKPFDCPMMIELPMEATISPDGKRIVVAYEHMTASMGCRATGTVRSSATWERR